MEDDIERLAAAFALVRSTLGSHHPSLLRFERVVDTFEGGEAR
jgi:hypothetical protein